MTTWLVLKGIAGFGDRLMTLARALQLAVATGRTLVIDWSQDSWNHDPVNPKGFWHYFDLVGLPPTVKIVRGDAETYALLDRLSAEGVAALPSIFRGQLRRTDWGLKQNRLHIGDAPVQLTESVIQIASEPILVYLAYCSGPMELIVPSLRFRTLIPVGLQRPVIGVHFRNTDKANSLSAILDRVAHVWRAGRSIYLATDDLRAIDAFCARFGEDVEYRRPPPPPVTGGGIHHVMAEDLAAVGTTKEELTHDMVRDLLRLRSAVVFVDSPNSLFSRIVQVLRSGGLKDSLCI